MGDPTPPRDGGTLIYADEIAALRKQIRDLRTASGTQQAQAVANLQQTIEALPVNDLVVVRASNFGLSSGWNTVVTATVNVPASKSLAKVMVVGTGAVLDKTSGGLTTAYGRIDIAGDVSGSFPAAKDAGVSIVNNVIVATHGRSWSVTPGGSFTVLMQMQPLNPLAFTTDANNFAQIAVNAVFTGGA